MTQPEAIFFDCGSILVDSEMIYSHAYTHMFQEFGITLGLAEIFKRFEGVRLYEIIDTINAEHSVSLRKATLEPIYRAEVAHPLDSELKVVAGTQAPLDAVSVLMCVVSNNPVSKMRHSLGRTGLLHHFVDRLHSGYDIQHQKPNPALMSHAARTMQVKAGNCTLMGDFSAGTQSGIAAGMEVFYFCADPYSRPIDHPRVTTFTDLAGLPALRQARGWDIARQGPNERHVGIDIAPLSVCINGKQNQRLVMAAVQ